MSLRLPIAAKILLLALAYVVAGRLSLLLAIPPGFASAIFPPIGIALAAVLIWGYPLLLGVFLGSTLLNLSIGYSATGQLNLPGLWVALGIALGTSLQCFCATWLIRRWVHFPNPLIDEKSIFLLLLLGGPLTCLLSASVGASVLLMAGIIDPSQFPFSWWTWWVGDSIGVLIATPLMFTLFAQPRELWRARLTSVGLPLVVSCAVMVAAFVRASDAEQDNLRIRFHEQAKLIAATLEFRFELYSKALRSVERFIATTERLNKEKFASFTADLPSNYPGIRALSWNALVSNSQRASYEASMVAEGFKDFQITEQDSNRQLIRAQPRASYVAITYIQPFAQNRAAPGFDVASVPMRTAALQRAFDTTKVAMTAPITLIQDKSNEPATLLFYPVFHTPSAPEKSGTFKQLRGYTVAVLEIKELIDNALKAYPIKDFQLQLMDISNGEPALLYSNLSSDVPAYAQSLIWQGETKIGGRTLQLSVSPTNNFLLENHELQPWALLAGGLLLCSFLGGFLLTMTGRTDQIQNLIAKRTLELHAILDNAAEAILTVTTDGTIEQANAAATKLFGYNANQLTRLNLNSLMPELAGNTGEHLHRLVNSTTELVGLDQSHQILTLELSLSDYELHGSKRYTCMLRDIASRKQIERLKSEFIATVSHELRTPLTSIKGSLRLLTAGAAGELPSKAQELLEIAESNSERLASLVNDILDIEKLEFGETPIQLKPEPLRPLLEDSLKFNQGYASNFNVSLALDLSQLPEQLIVAVDSQRIQQVLANLISNAVKFSPTGAQVMLSSCVEDGQVKVTVSDHGPGISPEFRERIFQKFAQADGSDKRRHGGTGLGLSICKTLMERMHGSIGFHSIPGHGSQFYFSLPIVKTGALGAPHNADT